MTKSIIVGFDGSPESEVAVRWAADEANACGCALKIMSTFRLPVGTDIYAGFSPTEATMGLMESTNTLAEQAGAMVRSTHPDVEVDVEVQNGVAADVLVKNAPTQGDMIVVGASSHHGASAFWLGSTPRAVVRRASCPVVVVRGAAAHARPDRIVVGIDGSPSAMSAVRWAAAEADLHGVTLVITHAWDYPYETGGPIVTQARELTRIDAERVLDIAVEQARELCGGDVIGDLIEGSPGSALLAAVRDGDLLVLGSRGRGAWRSGVFGSTVNGVLDTASVPVVVVRGDDG